MKQINDDAHLGFLMGSDSDYEVMIEAGRALKEFGISFEMMVSSAHRTLERTAEYVKNAPGREIALFIVGAGVAAHLGAVAAETVLPVVAVPIDASSLKGLDALLATVQMPAGIPVATMAIGKAGARNAGIFAAQMLGIENADIRASLVSFKKTMAEKVIEKSDKLQQKLVADGF